MKGETLTTMGAKFVLTHLDCSQNLQKGLIYKGQVGERQTFQNK